MRAGPLRHRLVLEVATETRDAHGQPIQAWGTVTTLAAQVMPIRGTERQYAGAPDANVSHEITLRYYPGTLTPKHRFRMGSRVFGVVSAVNFETRNRRTVVHALESV